jgi:hypothetical protein
MSGSLMQRRRDGKQGNMHPALFCTLRFGRKVGRKNKWEKKKETSAKE